LESRDLLNRLRRGDDEAFDAIFRAWYAPLVRMAERLVDSRAVAEEIVQDVMLELWRRREHLADEGSPQAYLFQATRNRALNHLRHERVIRRTTPQVAPPSSIEATGTGRLVQGEMERAAEAALSSLPGRCRETFELSRVHSMKYAEIARVLGVSIKTVEADMGKALRALREHLAPWIQEPDRR
jgi:RNA polymerase sigma-70 factor (ECF subfamily)